MTNESILPNQPSVIAKKDLTDAQLCGAIVYRFHYFPNRAYLTTDDFLSWLIEFVNISKERLEKTLWELAEVTAITNTSFENQLKNIPHENRWHWSIRMGKKDGDDPNHISFEWNNSNDTLQ